MESNPNPRGVENISPYEREKVEMTIRQLEQTAEFLRTYLNVADLIGAMGIHFADHDNRLDDLRYPTGLAGPESDLRKLHERALGMAHRVQHVAQAQGVDLRSVQEEGERMSVKAKVDQIVQGGGTFAGVRRDELITQTRRII